MPQAAQPNSTFVRDLQAMADTAALLARLFPRRNGGAAGEPCADPVTPRRPAPAAAHVLEAA